MHSGPEHERCTCCVCVCVCVCGTEQFSNIHVMPPHCWQQKRLLWNFSIFYCSLIGKSCGFEKRKVKYSVSARRGNRAMKMQRETCIGSAQLRGSEKKKNGAKIASERETNSLQSLKGPRKTVASRYHHHHHHHRPHGGYNHSRFFSSYPHRHLQKYHLQCLAEPVVSICLI